MKKEKKSKLALLPLILSLAALALSGLSFAAVPEDQTHLINDLYEENRQLESRVDALEKQLEQLLTVTNLQSWNLDVEPWADSTGADVTFTAVPSGYQSGVSATFLVEREGQQVAAVPCQWDGGQFTAAVSLDALDGYGYYCQLTSPGGTQLLPLATPDSPNGVEAVYLQSGLGAYCNLVVNGWTESGDGILVKEIYAQAQLPRIGGEDLQITNAELVVWYNSEEFARMPITLNPSEVAGSFEATITDQEIPLPEMEAGECLELHLEVRLSDGRNLKAFGISWYLEGGELTSAVG